MNLLWYREILALLRNLVAIVYLVGAFMRWTLHFCLNSFITMNFLLRTFPLSSSKINLCSKRCLGVIGWVPMSLIDSRHDELCAHKKKKKMSKIRRQVSRQPQQNSQNPCVGWLPMMLGTRRSNNNDKRSVFQWVDSFRMEMARFEAILR
jgi:hypothetical protein